jgi:Protein of unknown function (DUF4242)
MNSYLVERYLPGLTTDALRSALQRAQTACAQLSAAGAPVSYRGSMFLPDEEACFCRFDAETPETVARVNEMAEVQFDRITPALPLAPDDRGPGNAVRLTQTKAGGGSDVDSS